MVKPKAVQRKNNDGGESANHDLQPAVQTRHQNDVVLNMFDGSLALFLTNEDVLDCPICTESLSVPVFQCKNGHILCYNCCIKVKDKCPYCCTETEFIRCRPIEKVLASLSMSCQNTPYGCKEKFPYSEKRIHDNMCMYTPCSCPLATCNFVGSSADLVTHCNSHDWDHLAYDNYTGIFMSLSQEYAFYQEFKEGNIFIVRNKCQPNGNAFSVSCIGPRYMKKGFAYDLIACFGSSKGSRLRLQSTTEVVQGLPTNEPDDLITSLIVPDKWLCDDYLGTIKLGLYIWKDRKQPDLVDFIR